MKNPHCIKCGNTYNPRRAELGYRTCMPCGSLAAVSERKSKFIIIEVNKSNPVVGTRAELAAANAKGPRTW